MMTARLPTYPKDPEILSYEEAKMLNVFPILYLGDRNLPEIRYLCYCQCPYCGYVFHIRNYTKRKKKTNKFLRKKLEKAIKRCKECRLDTEDNNFWLKKLERIDNKLDLAIAQMELKDLRRPAP